MGIIKLKNAPAIECAYSVVGKREHDGPLGSKFDFFDDSDKFGMNTWEKAESEMQRMALDGALTKSKSNISDIGAIFAGDLLNQCTGSAYGLAGFDAPFFGLYGACSTCAEALILSSMLVDSHKLERAAAVCSSHNCSAERQFRFPLEYGGQRTPTAQWTVTGSAAFIIGTKDGLRPRITAVLPGIVVDKGITDISNMGAAMAPEAVDTLYRYFSDSGEAPDDFDAIVTGDLGREGSSILVEMLAKNGFDISKNHYDCGLMIYDREKQDMHAGGSGCGCSGTVLAAHFLEKLKALDHKRILFMATGAMMSPSSVLQGLAIPGIAHLIKLEMATEKGVD
ncbi:MAG: stage V sporulation protein AD [Clostridia bacterium]|nr:stage V sporulation protein AD [Clostridia bacterium]